ncbi:Rossmann-like and DUF2520 domain-containing protein [Lutibacter flavus]|uniref:Predicted oxidoreductase, contains short-chain dehydrogenase (SDR) and DUF2520 domains n=1 Tax=Lutibacter flavus TaxID=691689 RepID=A0A238VHQ5_9FLAO|nr:DUF2520 domain-containing protein [Lutibacter flavus]SNR33637.1 Predicted oxidoreductase, contains short-chain dehydrogenase (SDR) and DUF2520 domains [Lutibacter flavus]
MIKVVLLGGGNLAFHLTKNLLNNKAVNLIQVYNRSIDKIQYLKSKTAITDNLNALEAADIYVVAVADNAISEVSSKLNFKNKLVVHTSGAANLNELKSKSNKGVFYPLQTFSKENKIDFTSIPICIEAETKTDLDLLEKLAKSIAKKYYLINSEQRKHLHVAAVFVNNFVNHLYHIGNEICEENGIPFEILHPLIEKTSKKIVEIPPLKAQTGPAKRNDTKTIKNHKAILNKQQKEIYNLLTKSIQNTYGKKL